MALNANVIPWLRGHCFNVIQKPAEVHAGKILLDHLKNTLKIRVDEERASLCKEMDKIEHDVLCTPSISCEQVESFGRYISIFQKLYENNVKYPITFKYGTVSSDSPKLHVFGSCIFILNKIFGTIITSPHTTMTQLGVPCRLIMMAECIRKKALSVYEESFKAIASEQQLTNCELMLQAWNAQAPIFIGLSKNMDLNKIAQLIANAAPGLEMSDDKELSELFLHFANVVRAIGLFKRSENVGEDVATLVYEEKIISAMTFAPEVVRFTKESCARIKGENEKIYREFTRKRNPDVKPAPKNKFNVIEVFPEIELASLNDDAKSIFAKALADSNAFIEAEVQKAKDASEAFAKIFPMKEQKALHEAINDYTAARDYCQQLITANSGMKKDCPDLYDIVQKRLRTNHYKANLAEEAAQEAESLITFDGRFQKMVDNFDLDHDLFEIKHEYEKGIAPIIEKEKATNDISLINMYIESIEVKRNEAVKAASVVTENLKNMEDAAKSGKESFQKFRDCIEDVITDIKRCRSEYNCIKEIIEDNYLDV